MELLEGESLQDRLERGRSFGEREFLSMAYDVLEVLQAAHERGVVHRDLKPENLFFAREGGDDGEPIRERLKVLDFGLARVLAWQSITTYGLALGTPSFMSPEQAGGRLDQIDGRTDLFALAATGFRLRTGRRIHEGDNPVELVTKMSRLPAPRIRSVVRDVSAPYARVIDKALEFRRDDRYESAAAMRDDVKRALDELDAGTREPPAPPPAPPRRARAATQPRPLPAEATIELSERDLERPPAYGIDESIRIPKNQSVLPWLSLLLLGAVGVALWRDPSHGAQWFHAIASWASSLIAPAASGGAADGASATSPDGSPRTALDAGAGPRSGASSAPRAPATSSGGPAHRAAPVRLGPGNVQNLR
jgi:serine/threonine protein kinase